VIYHSVFTKVQKVALGGLLVIVLAFGPKVRGLKPGRGLFIFKGDKNPQHTFFGWEVKPSVPWLKILRHF
jgi:hypothetical protein